MDTSRITAQLVGPGQQPFHSFQEACDFYMTTYCNPEHPLGSGHVFPAIFDVKFPELLDADMSENRRDLAKFRKGDNAELILHRSLQSLASADTEHSCVAMMNFKIDTLKQNILRDVLKSEQIKQLDERYELNFKELCSDLKLKKQKRGMGFESDAILIHSKLGIMLFECKSERSYSGRAHKQHSMAHVFIKSIIGVLFPNAQASSISYHRIFVVPNIKDPPYGYAKHQFITEKDLIGGIATEWFTTYIASNNQCPAMATSYNQIAGLILGLHALARGTSDVAPTISSDTLNRLKPVVSTGHHIAQQCIGISNNSKKQNKAKIQNSSLVLQEGSRLVEAKREVVGQCQIVLLSPAQNSIIGSSHKHMIITGAAGSGKTLCMVAKISQLLWANNNLSSVDLKSRMTVVGCNESLRRIKECLTSAHIDIDNVFFLDTSLFAQQMQDILHNTSEAAGNVLICPKVLEIASATRHVVRYDNYQEVQRLLTDHFTTLLSSEIVLGTSEIELPFGHLFIDDTFATLHHAFMGFVALRLYSVHYSSQYLWVTADGNQYIPDIMNTGWNRNVVQQTFFKVFELIAANGTSSCESIMRYTESVFRELYQTEDGNYPYFYDEWKPHMPLLIAHRRQGVEPMIFKIPVKSRYDSTDICNQIANKVAQLVDHLVDDIPPCSIAVIGQSNAFVMATDYEKEALETIKSAIQERKSNIVCRIINETDLAEVDDPQYITICCDRFAYSCEWPVVIYIDPYVYNSENEVVTKLPEQYLGKSRCTTFLITIQLYEI